MVAARLRLLLRPAARFAAAVALALGAASGAQAAVVSTLAGSGSAGLADGAPGTASFLMPVAVAYDRDGSLVVADAAAQRIRRVRPDGRVETIAGSGALEKGALAVRGGFADGPGATARFNWPRGVAVARNGTIYVADTGNHCIRAIAPGGRVSVYAGSPARAGGEAGPRERATFSAPAGLAGDAAGNLYVADPKAGLRKIDPAGNVSAIALGRAPTGVTVLEQSDGLTLFVVDSDGILIAYPDGRRWRMRSLNDAAAPAAGPASADPPGTVERDIAMQAPVGYARSLTVLAGDHMFYADPRASTVRYAFPGYAFAETLAGMAAEDASGEGAGYRDGAARDARFDAPTGTAASADGTTIAVADAGNRRIRLIKLDVAHDLAQKSSIVPEGDVPDDAYRILYLAPSWSWYDSTGSDSVSAQLENQLRADGALARAKLVPAVRFINGVATLEPLESLARTVADLSVDKLVIVDLTQNSVETDLKKALDDPAAWQSKITARLRAANAILSAAHIRFAVDIHPLPMEYSANEYPASRNGLPGLGTGRIPELRMAPLLRQAVLAAGVELIDTYPEFVAEAHQPAGPVSAMVDSHYSVHGRMILARAIAHGIERLAPWSSP